MGVAKKKECPPLVVSCYPWGGNCCPPLFWQTLQAYPFAILCRCLLLFWLLRAVALLGRGLCSPLALLCGVPSVYPRSLFWYDASKENVMFAACLGMPFRLSSGGYSLAHGAHYSITFFALLVSWSRSRSWHDAIWI